MIFIFPKNYKFNLKLFGFIDYKTVIFDIIYGLMLFFVIKIFSNISIKIYAFICLYFPIILISFFGINEENIIDILKYILKYVFCQKIILYDK